MKYRILVLVFVLFTIPCQQLFSQTLQHNVIASAGDVFILDNLEITWTLGECFTETYQSGNIIIRQGFHQPIFNFYEIPEQEDPVFQVSIYPNPAARFVRVDLKDRTDKENFRLILSDMMGKVLISKLINMSNQAQLDLLDYSSGILLLKIIRVSDGMQRSFKIVRSSY